MRLTELEHACVRVNPRRGSAIHDAMLREKGLAGLIDWLALAGQPAGPPRTAWSPAAPSICPKCRSQ